METEDFFKLVKAMDDAVAVAMEDLGRYEEYRVDKTYGTELKAAWESVRYAMGIPSKI